jgi:mannose-6-phosphate isomerase-like protein (cupin superfamily)
MRAFRPLFNCFALLSVAILFAACSDTGDAVTSPGLTPHFTAGSGSMSTLLGRATFAQGANLKVKRVTGDWHVEVKAHPDLDVAVQQIVFQPGGQSGWHSHPGPVFIQVVSGTMTFYESDDPNCTPIVRSAGQGFLDVGEHAHIARNETGSTATNVVTYLAPPGAALRIDQPNPGNCPF